MTKVAVIGAGRWGKNHIRTLSEMGILGGVIESHPDMRQMIQSEYNDIPVFASLEDERALDFDAYTVVVPAKYHYDIAKTLLLNDKHVLVEKPLTLTVSDSQELNDLAKARKRILMVGHLLLFHPAFKKMKTLISDGTLGKIQYLYSNRLNLGTVRTEENSLWSFAPHDISLFQFLIGEQPDEVSSVGGAFLQPHIHDSTMTTFKYPDNIVAHIFVSWLHPFKEHRFVVIGSKGMLSFEDSSAEKQLLFYEKGIDWVNGEPVKRDGPTETIPYDSSPPLREELQHFIDCINGECNNDLISGKKGQDVLEILAKADASLHKEKSTVGARETSASSTKYFLHPTVSVGKDVSIGDGTKIWQFSNVLNNIQIGKKCILGQNVSVGSNVKIGNFCKIQNNVSVYEGVELEDYVFCGPSMVFTNIMVPRSKYPQAESKYYQKTLVKEGASIGANATIVCGSTLGRFSFIGAGAVVTKDVPDFAIMVGNPAKQVGWMTEAGVKMDFSNTTTFTCPKSGITYELSDNNVSEVLTKKEK